MNKHNREGPVHNALAPTSPASNSPTVSTADLRILATSDLHMHVSAFDYYIDRVCFQRGLAMTAGLIAQARAEAPNCLLFDNGDFLHGSPLGDHVILSERFPHPMVAAMNSLGYDAVNLGNHEFSHGVEFLLRSLEDASFPGLSSNCFLQPGGRPLLHREIILNREIEAHDGSRHALRIGLTGVLPPQTTIWDKRAIGDGLVLTDMTEAVAAAVDRLRARGVDLVVVLAHCGIGAGDSRPGAENAGLDIAAIPGIDALVLGHVHLTFPNDALPDQSGVDQRRGHLHGVPTVLPGALGSHLGVIDLKLANRGGTWRVTASSSRLEAISRRDEGGRPQPVVSPDRQLERLVAEAHDATRLWTRRAIATTDQPLNTFFAMVHDGPALHLIHRAQIDHVQRRLADTEWAHLPILSAAAPFRAGGRGGPDNFVDIPAGEVLLRHIVELCIHPNTVGALLVTGHDLRRWLNHAARVFLPVRPGIQHQMLLDPDRPSHHFDCIAGLTYQIDLSAPCEFDRGHDSGRSRIRDLAWQGQPVTDDQQFVLATNSYRLGGAGGFIGPTALPILSDDPTQTRDAVLRHIAEAPIPPIPRPGWSLVAAPGTSVLFDTAPAATNHLGDLHHLDLEPLGFTPEGFLRLRLGF